MFGFFEKKKKRAKKVLTETQWQGIKISSERNPSVKPKRGQKFGGYTVDFSNQNVTLEDLFGSKPVTTPEMTKKLWQHIKKNKLGGR